MAAGGRRAVVLAQALFVLVTVTGCPVVSKTLGSVVEPLQESVTAVIDEAALQGNALLLTAAGQVALAVSNVESAFAEDLHRGIDQVDDATRARVDQLTDLVASLQAGTTALLTQAIDGSQQLINSLPFTNRNPQVRGYTPRYVGPRATTVAVQVQGNFFWAMQQGMTPTLTLGATTFRPVESTTTRLGFELPAMLLRGPAGGMPTSSLELVAPYEKGRVFHSIRPGTFRLLLTALPAHPVTELTVTSAREVTGQERQSHLQPANGAGWRVNSWVDCKYHSDPHLISASPGWWIEPGTVRVEYLSRGVEARGKAHTEHVQITGFLVIGETWPNCDPLGVISSDSGDITYQVRYEESRPTHTTTNETVDVLAGNPDFTWGDQLAVPVARGHWTLHAQLWDGTVLEGSSTDTTSNRYLVVRDQGETLEIAVAAPERLT